jgi:hypothetical protein
MIIERVRVSMNLGQHESQHESLDCFEVLCLKYRRRAGVAQSVEQGTENPRVSGSIPLPGISFCAIASAG